jgi:hypothetical protein
MNNINNNNSSTNSTSSNLSKSSITITKIGNVNKFQKDQNINQKQNDSTKSGSKTNFHNNKNNKPDSNNTNDKSATRTTFLISFEDKEIVPSLTNSKKTSTKLLLPQNNLSDRFKNLLEAKNNKRKNLLGDEIDDTCDPFEYLVKNHEKNYDLESRQNYLKHKNSFDNANKEILLTSIHSNIAKNNNNNNKITNNTPNLNSNYLEVFHNTNFIQTLSVEKPSIDRNFDSLMSSMHKINRYYIHRNKDFLKALEPKLKFTAFCRDTIKKQNSCNSLTDSFTLSNSHNAGLTVNVWKSIQLIINKDKNFKSIVDILETNSAKPINNKNESPKMTPSVPFASHAITGPPNTAIINNFNMNSMSNYSPLFSSCQNNGGACLLDQNNNDLNDDLKNENLNIFDPDTLENVLALAGSDDFNPCNQNFALNTTPNISTTVQTLSSNQNASNSEQETHAVSFDQDPRLFFYVNDMSRLLIEILYKILVFNYEQINRKISLLTQTTQSRSENKTFFSKLNEKKAKILRDLTKFEIETKNNEANGMNQFLPSLFSSTHSMYAKFSHYFFEQIKRNSVNSLQCMTSKYIRYFIDFYKILHCKCDAFIKLYAKLLTDNKNESLDDFFNYHLVEFKLFIEDILNELVYSNNNYNNNNNNNKLDSELVNLIRSIVSIETKFIISNDSMLLDGMIDESIKDPRLDSKTNAERSNSIILESLTFGENSNCSYKSSSFDEKKHKLEKYKAGVELDTLNWLNEINANSSFINSISILDLHFENGEIVEDEVEMNRLASEVLNLPAINQSSKQIPLNSFEISNSFIQKQNQTENANIFNNVQVCSVNNNNNNNSTISLSPPKTPFLYRSNTVQNDNSFNTSTSTPNLFRYTSHKNSSEKQVSLADISGLENLSMSLAIDGLFEPILNQIKNDLSLTQIALPIVNNGPAEVDENNTEVEFIYFNVLEPILKRIEQGITEGRKRSRQEDDVENEQSRFKFSKTE